MIKRIGNEFSFHMMFYGNLCALYPPDNSLDIKTHKEFRKTLYEMKIHFRSYIYNTIFISLTERNCSDL